MTAEFIQGSAGVISLHFLPFAVQLFMVHTKQCRCEQLNAENVLLDAATLTLAVVRPFAVYMH